MCFGDSNTWGYNAETGQRYAEGIRWTSLLDEKLGDSCRIIEEGLPGRTSVVEDPLFEGLSGLSYIFPCLMSHSPVDLVVIMLGTNDTKERFSLTSYNIAQGIVRLALKAKGSGSGPEGGTPEILVVAPPPIGENYIDSSIGKAMGTGCSEKSGDLPEHLAALLSGTGIHFIDSREYVSMNEIDFMHLDEEGHRKLAEFVQYHARRILN